MSKGIGCCDQSKVISLDKFRQPPEKKLRWWNKLHPLRVLQVPIGIVIGTLAVYGTVLSTEESGHSTATIWAIAFWLMFFFWACEFHIRNDYY
ncbi:MAG: hypothetical protein WAV98_01435 [Minisyncoccia bacterium]